VSEQSPIAVIVLNWNNAEDTLECIQSLRTSDVPLHVVVVDNGSVDDSADLVERSGLADVVLRTGANLGYAGGNNVGLRYALRRQFEMVAVLNNDTIAPAGLFLALLEHVRADPNSAFSPLITYADEPDSFWFAGGILDRGWPRHLQAHEVPDATGTLQPTETVTGCLVAAAPAVWNRVGFFDEGMFLIFEDSDWSIRARQAGVRLFVARDGTLAHKVSRSFRGGPMSLLGPFYFVRNGLTFQSRHSRRYAPRFFWMWVLRPSLKVAGGRGPAPQAAFAWLAAICFLCRQRGKAPRVLETVARWLSRAGRGRQREGS
jgi:GT2 family glycosyltransferase